MDLGQIAAVNKNATMMLSEITRGLSSPDAGTQCYTLARIPAQVEAYPFPVVLDAVFTHISEVYSKGPNYIRANILHVFRECSKHLDKLSRPATYANIINQTMCQTDPTTRALSLRLAGCMNGLLRDEATIHNNILFALDSKYPVEVDAALWASERYAARSTLFADGLRSKCIEMLESLKTDPDVKLKMLTISQHFHHSAEALEQIRNCFLALLSEHQSTEFLTSIIHTLTLLAVRARIHASEQIDLVVVTQLNAEVHRPFVQACLLRDVRLLVRKVAHLWMPVHIQALCEFALKSSSSRASTLLYGSSLRILRELVDSGAATASLKAVLEVGEDNPIGRVTHTAAHSKDPCLQSRGLQLMVALELAGLAPELADEVDLAVTCLFADSSFFVKTPPAFVKGIYHCIIQRYRKTGRIPHKDIVRPLLQMNVAVPLQLHCEFLCALYEGSCSSEVRSSLKSVLPLLTRASTDTGLSLCLLLLSSGELADEGMSAILNFTESQNAWTVYKIARAAARFGHFSLAGHLLSGLVPVAVSDRFDGWLRSLRELSWSVECLSPSVDLNGIAKSMRHLVFANSYLPNSSGQLWFAKGYVQGRLQWVKGIYELTWATLHFPERQDGIVNNIPADQEKPPKLGADELRHCLGLFKEFVIGLRKLMVLCLDAEEGTLDHLNVLCYKANVIIYLLNAIITNKLNDRIESVPNYSGNSTSQSGHVTKLVNRCVSSIKSFLSKSVSEDHATLTALKEVQTLAISFLSSRLCLPRFFFQRLQTTEIKLAMSPKSKTNSECVRVDCNHDIVLKVEGIVRQQWSGPRPVRAIHKVIIHVECPNAPEISHSQSAPIQKDYFKVACLMHFPDAGEYQLHISVRPVDGQGQAWELGQREILSLYAVDPQAHLGNQHQQHSNLQTQPVRPQTHQHVKHQMTIKLPMKRSL